MPLEQLGVSRMRAIIRNMSEMSDSREMMEARTSPAITVFITVVLALIVAALTWSFVGEIDEIAKATGIVRPNEKISTVQISALGQIDEVFVKEGVQVNNGTKLVTLKQDELLMELNNRRAEKNKLDKELQLWSRYEQSISENNNLFSKANEEEKYYYDLVEQFQMDLVKMELDYRAAILQIDTVKTELSQAQESVQQNIIASKQKVEYDKQELNRKILITTQELEQEQSLQAAMQLTDGSLTSLDEKRSSQFKQYSIRISQLERTVADSKAVYDRSIELGDRFVAQTQIDKEWSQYETAKLQLEQFKEEAILGVASHIDSLDKQLDEWLNSLNLLDAPNSSTEIERQSLLLQQKQLEDKQHETSDKADLTGQTEEATLQKFKLDRLVQIQAVIEEKQQARVFIQEKVTQLEAAINKNTITAPISGTVNVVKEISAGGIIQPGETLLSIIPINETKYKMNIAVPNHEIGKIKIGNKVELNFQAFPKQSFGSLQGVITSIATDAIVQQDGKSYYVVEASVPNTPLTNRKGEQGEIRVGMTAEAYVITDSKKIIHYLLEKINLRE